MKSVALKLFMVTVLSGIAFSLFAAPEDKDKRYAMVVKPVVKLSEVSEPKVSYSSALSIPQISKTHFNKWMMILVDFTVGLKEVKDNEKAILAIKKQRNATLLKKGLKPDWLDNVEVTVRGMFETMTGETKQHVIFTNATKLWALRLNDSRHLVLFFLPPHIADRYYVPHPLRDDAKQKRDNKGKEDHKPFRYNKLLPKHLTLEVVINADGSELAREYLNVKFSDDESKQLSDELKRAKEKDRAAIIFAWQKKKFSTLVNSIPGNYNLEGALLSREQSPWAYYKYDQFDLEKKNH